MVVPWYGSPNKQRQVVSVVLGETELSKSLACVRDQFTSNQRKLLKKDTSRNYRKAYAFF